MYFKRPLKVNLKDSKLGTSLVVQWLRLCASIVGDTGSIPGQGTKIPHAAQCGQKKLNKIKDRKLI